MFHQSKLDTFNSFGQSSGADTGADTDADLAGLVWLGVVAREWKPKPDCITSVLELPSIIGNSAYHEHMFQLRHDAGVTRNSSVNISSINTRA